MKLCKDCKYVKPRYREGFLFTKVDYRFADCSHKEAKIDPTLCLADGKTYDRGQTYATVMRTDYFPCGEEARLFEPKR